jgi:hypothetical protein
VVFFSGRITNAALSTLRVFVTRLPLHVSLPPFNRPKSEEDKEAYQTLKQHCSDRGGVHEISLAWFGWLPKLAFAALLRREDVRAVAEEMGYHLAAEGVDLSIKEHISRPDKIPRVIAFLRRQEAHAAAERLEAFYTSFMALQPGEIPNRHQWEGFVNKHLSEGFLRNNGQDLHAERVLSLLGLELDRARELAKTYAEETGKKSAGESDIRWITNMMTAWCQPGCMTDVVYGLSSMLWGQAPEPELRYNLAAHDYERESGEQLALRVINAFATALDSPFNEQTGMARVRYLPVVCMGDAESDDMVVAILAETMRRKMAESVDETDPHCFAILWGEGRLLKPVQRILQLPANDPALCSALALHYGRLKGDLAATVIADPDTENGKRVRLDHAHVAALAEKKL